MSFGKKASVDNTPKANVNNKIKEMQDDIIIEHIMCYIKSTDAECVDIQRIKNTLPGVKNIDDYIDKCIKKYGYIKHKGWVYGKLWSINDINSISNTIVGIDNYDTNNINTDNNLMRHLRIINSGAGVNTKWLEAICQCGVLGMTREQMMESLKRLISCGKVYEPVIGTFVPLSFKD